VNDDTFVAEVSFVEEGIPPSLAIVRAVAGSEGVHPVDLPPLYDAIPSSRLDALFQEDESTKLEFTYHGYEITVLDDGRIVARKSE
jgi:hypothetical protein